MRPIVLTALVLACLAAPVLAGVSDAEWKEKVQAFNDDFKKRSIKFKKRAIEILPTNDERTIDFIIKKQKLLSHKDWWIRTTAAERLGKIKIPELRKKLLAYAENRDKRIREGILAALAMSEDRLDAPVIVKALKDPAWEVRRMACWAAGMQRVREAVEPMIGMLHEVGRDGTVIQEGETHPRVASVLLYNLEEITGKTDIGTDVIQWRQWWEQNKDRALPPRVRRFDVGMYGDVKLETNDTYARRGSGPLVIALPMPHHLTTYYMPYLNRLLFVKWLFINLPPAKSFPDVQINKYGDPIYPVDLLVDAFEDIRKKRGVEKMVLMGHGFSCWVAAKYAQKYPDRVAGLILLNPYASQDTFAKRIDEAKRSGDPDAEFWAKVSSYEIRIASRIEAEIYSYYVNTAYLGPRNRDDLEIGILRKIWRDPKSTSIEIPEFDIRGEETSPHPCLMFFADKSNELTGIDGVNRLKRYYPKYVVINLKKKAARLPFMEAPELFEKALRLFIEKKILR